MTTQDYIPSKGGTPVLSKIINYKSIVGNLSLSSTNNFYGKGNIAAGYNLSINGRYNNVNGTGHIIQGDNHSISGYDNTVMGFNHIVGGNSHNVSGNENVAIGTSHILQGNNIVAIGDGHSIAANNVFAHGTGASVSSSNHFIINAPSSYAVTSTVSTSHDLSLVNYKEKYFAVGSTTYSTYTTSGFVDYTTLSSIIPTLTITAENGTASQYEYTQTFCNNTLLHSNLKFTATNTGASASSITRWLLDLGTFSQPYTNGAGVYNIDIQANCYVLNPGVTTQFVTLESCWGVICGTNSGIIFVSAETVKSFNTNDTGLEASNFVVEQVSGISSSTTIQNRSSMGSGLQVIYIDQNVEINYTPFVVL